MSEYTFNPSEAYEQIRTQQLEWMSKIGAKKVVFGVSGGKDSTAMAWLEAKILGKENVIGVMMPNGLQKDIGDSMRVIRETGIKSYIVDISNAVNALSDQLSYNGIKASEDTKINLPPRIRMATLFAVGQTEGAIVLNTDNRDEIVAGYYTLFGDGAGSYGPIRNLTVSEVIELGVWLGAPEELMVKKPGDGLQALGDEERLGFKYYELDNFIRKNEGSDDFKKMVLERKEKNKFKTDIVNIPAPTFSYPDFTESWH